mgnify:CR=1 FL=1
MITPLDEHGGFDAASAERLYRYLVDCGVHGLFLCGSSGEGPWLADETRLASIELFHQLGLNVFIFDYRGYGQSRPD